MRIFPSGWIAIARTERLGVGHDNKPQTKELSIAPVVVIRLILTLHHGQKFPHTMILLLLSSANAWIPTKIVVGFALNVESSVPSDVIRARYCLLVSPL